MIRAVVVYDYVSLKFVDGRMGFYLLLILFTHSVLTVKS